MKMYGIATYHIPEKKPQMYLETMQTVEVHRFYFRLPDFENDQMVYRESQMLMSTSLTACVSLIAREDKIIL